MAARYEHLSRQPLQFDWFWDLRQRICRGVVQDRFHLGEWVYPQVRGEQPLSLEEIRLVEAQLRLVGSYVVVLTATPNVITRHLRERLEAGCKDMYDTKQILEANRLFGMLPKTFDVDRMFFLQERFPYVTDDEVDEIAQSYLERQYLIDMIVSRRFPEERLGLLDV